MCIMVALTFEGEADCSLQVLDFFYWYVGLVCRSGRTAVRSMRRWGATIGNSGRGEMPAGEDRESGPGSLFQVMPEVNLYR